MVRASVVASTALKSATLKASANVTTQLVARWRAGHALPFDWQRVLEFAVFGIIGASIGCVWQEALEVSFPTRRAAPRKQPGLEDAVEKKDAVPNAPAPASPAEQLQPQHAGAGGTSWWNVVIKLLLDQTVGLLVMNTIFLTVTNLAHVASVAEIPGIVNQRVWRIVRAGWNVWPLVAVANFLWVPVESRVVVAACVGFGWSIFLSVISMKS
ncbi:hypothetical protein NKR23_g9731 [Pleurostoma richardsiae]|jgi:hypothetical protein|uniref:Uncharacterized protein n=1 Tax=Pleurostoma richardsiae TaxID=41990 RepID=A0AA38RBW7_9PEZI|nr:hypothetical protein NKR23_g9731 [Pleurostoma richardsiae]